jgi:hypothetical protein
MALHLDQHCEAIAELSVNASKQEAIERSLGSIAATWAGLQLDMAEYKGTHKLRSTEDIFAALEDNGVTLSTMKASKHHLVFEEQVAHWERTLALTSETVEMVLQVRAAHAGGRRRLTHRCDGISLTGLLPCPPWPPHPFCAGATQLDVPGEHLCRQRGHPAAAAAGNSHV